MDTRYVAYGLELRSSFPVQAMTPAAAGDLPRLALKRAHPRELAEAWCGSHGGRLWRGALDEGRSLTIELGVNGEALFTCGRPLDADAGARRTIADQICFRLGSGGGMLECAPSGDRTRSERVLISKVLPNVSMMLGYEGLHAAAVDSPGGVVAFAGTSGAGKSTLALEFMRRGWPLFADDLLMLRRCGGAVRAYPASGHMTVSDVSLDAVTAGGLGSILARLDGESWIGAARECTRPRPVRALFLLARARGRRLAADVLACNPLTLAPFMLGFRGSLERQRRRFELYADLIGAIKLVTLTGGVDEDPATLADVVEGTLAEAAPLMRDAHDRQPLSRRPGLVGSAI